MSLRDPVASLENCNKLLMYGNQLYLDELYESGLCIAAEKYIDNQYK